MQGIRHNVIKPPKSGGAYAPSPHQVTYYSITPAIYSKLDLKSPPDFNMEEESCVSMYLVFANNFRHCDRIFCSMKNQL